MSDDRPVAPLPRQNGESSRNMELTPDKVKQIELNRLRAKAKQRERELAAPSSSSSVPNANNKRPLGVTPATATSPTAPPPARPLRRDTRLGKYFEYDLSKMVNSKGGFLVEDAREPDADLRVREKSASASARGRTSSRVPMSLDPSKNPKCAECGSVDIDHEFRKVLRCLVCNRCKNEKPEKYSLLTKTECKEDYLLTDPELRDEELMPHLLKANPHKSTYSNMMLFLRYQVEDFAWKKWGSAEALDAEFERRIAEKKKRKSKKFEEGLKQLRRRTREGLWQRRKDEEHKHVFGVVERGNDGEGKQVCHECGFTIDVEEL
ncbi:XPA protein C-terminus-domain-containing protein [Phellopilus nigrolimitatus]|nr:XPA protein C-terminus-domain-containing protein [Phellopilus nigrolimitatus]